MKALGYHRGILLLAGLLLSLHSLVPHVHAGPHPGPGGLSVRNVPAPPHDLFALLQDFFTQSDLGEDHLEHFAADHDATPDFPLVTTLPPAALPAVIPGPLSSTAITRRQRIFRSRHLPPSGVYPDNAAPRGPPVHT